MTLIESHNNQDVFIADNDKSKIKFRVYYGTSEREKTKGFFTKIIVIEKTEEGLGDNLKSWLL